MELSGGKAATLLQGSTDEPRVSRPSERQTVASVLQHSGYEAFQASSDKFDITDIHGTSSTPLFRYLDRQASSSLDTSEILNSNPKPLYPYKERVPSSLKTMQRPYSAVGTLTVTKPLALLFEKHHDCVSETETDLVIESL